MAAICAGDARAAKQGILTVTDSRGRVLAEQQTGLSTFSSVVATVCVANQRTFYARNGDWFAWLDAIFAQDWKKLEPAVFAAVQIARTALRVHRDDARPLTVTGGLGFAGGPGNTTPSV